MTYTESLESEGLECISLDMAVFAFEILRLKKTRSAVLLFFVLLFFVLLFVSIIHSYKIVKHFGEFFFKIYFYISTL